MTLLVIWCLLMAWELLGLAVVVARVELSDWEVWPPNALTAILAVLAWPLVLLGWILELRR